MRTSRARGLRALAGWSAALLGALLLTLAIPMTTSAFTATITNSANSAVSKRVFTCADTFAGDRRRSSAYFEFALDEPANATTAVDSSDAKNPGTYRGSNAKDSASPKAPMPVACPNDSGDAYRLDGSTSRVSTSVLYSPITGSFSEEVWFKTTATGKLLGFESTSDDRSNNYDKHLYVGQDGRLIFGIYNGTVQTLQTSVAVNDGTWHYAAATASSAGSVLYLDGQQVDANRSYTTAEYYSGYWRLGRGNLDGGWPDIPGGDNWFTGSLRFAAAYPYVLTPGEVASTWSIGKPGVAPSPSATPVATASTVPEETATATAVPATDSPASPSASASSSAQPISSSPAASGGPAMFDPAPGGSEISTTPDGQ